VCPHYHDYDEGGGDGKPVNGFVGQSATGCVRMECTAPPLYNPVTGARENRPQLAASGRIDTLL
jgi:hypothetical protein